MSGTSTLRAQLEEHLRLIEEQRIEINRQRRQIEVQFRRTADIQAALDVINATLQRAAPILRPTQESPGTGNGNGRDRSLLTRGNVMPPRPSPA
jgi:hypothetical protein